MLASVLRKALNPAWPDSNIPEVSRMFVSLALIICDTQWLMVLSKITGLQSDVRSVEPVPLCKREMVPLSCYSVIRRGWGPLVST